MDPTFYHTLSYEGDLELINRLKEIDRKYELTDKVKIEKVASGEN